MDTLLKDFILSLVFVIAWITTVSSRKQEVCFYKTYNATCADNEVIQMELAHYGRMSVGSCIQDAFKIGCQEDVLGYFESLCSGRQSCQVELPDKRLAARHQPCARGLESYLQLEYNCIKVHTSSTPCGDNPIPVSGTQGLLANYITGRTGQGSAECPWVVRGSPGQKIRLTLHDYGVKPPLKSQRGGAGGPNSGFRQPERSDICHIYARVTEDTSKASIPLCRGEVREAVVYLSETESINIALTNPKHTQHSAYFLLRYEIVGCPNYVPPDGAVISHQGSVISVLCPETNAEWHVSCEGTRWTPEQAVTNCTLPGEAPLAIGALFKSALTLPHWILIVLILTAAIIIAVPILVIGILRFRRNSDTVITSVTNTQMDAEKYVSPPATKEYHPMLDKCDRSNKYIGGREYTTTVHRHMAVRPDAETPGVRASQTSGLPVALFPDADNETGQETPSYERYPQDNRHSSFKPYFMEHKYESPMVFQRTRSESDTSEPLYNEVYQEQTDSCTNQNGEHTGSDTGDVDQESAVSSTS